MAVVCQPGHYCLIESRGASPGIPRIPPLHAPHRSLSYCSYLSFLPHIPSVSPLVLASFKCQLSAVLFSFNRNQNVKIYLLLTECIASIRYANIGLSAPLCLCLSVCISVKCVPVCQSITCLFKYAEIIRTI